MTVHVLSVEVFHLENEIPRENLLKIPFQLHSNDSDSSIFVFTIYPLLYLIIKLRFFNKGLYEIFNNEFNNGLVTLRYLAPLVPLVPLARRHYTHYCTFEFSFD